MLYNKNWDQKLDVLSLESLVAWLEKQPASKTYNYENCSGKCLYGQYMAAHGIKWNESGGTGRHNSSAERSAFCDLVYAAVACEAPWTFGAALARAREALQRCHRHRETDMTEWKPISERLPWDEQPGRQFIRIEGYAEHSGLKWSRVYVGDAMARKLDDPEAILGFRAADIIRLCKDGDIDLHSAKVTHWMPAIYPALTQQEHS